MTYKDIDQPNWRNDPEMISTSSYKRKFAILPVICDGGVKVHLKFYYKKYQSWNTKHYSGDYSHTDFVENITEEEYIVRVLSDNL